MAVKLWGTVGDSGRYAHVIKRLSLLLLEGQGCFCWLRHRAVTHHVAALIFVELLLHQLVFVVLPLLLLLVFEGKAFLLRL